MPEPEPANGVDHELPTLPAELIPGVRPRVRLRSHDDVLAFIEEEASAARRLRLDAELKQDLRGAMGGIKLALDAANATKAALPPPAKAAGKVFSLSIILTAGTKILDISTPEA